MRSAVGLPLRSEEPPARLFASGAKVLVTTVKEAVDNALDACEEAGILPELRVEVFDEEDGEIRVAVEVMWGQSHYQNPPCQSDRAVMAGQSTEVDNP